MKVETVQERLVDQLGNYTATVEAQAVNNISAAMSNRIKAIYVDEGMRVSKGQRLVVLDDVNTTNYRIQVDNAKANLNNVQVEYNRALESSTKSAAAQSSSSTRWRPSSSTPRTLSRLPNAHTATQPRTRSSPLP